MKEQTAELRAVNLELEDKLKELRSLRDRLREQAIHDQLTGLYNRRFLTESLRREIARARRAAEPVAFLMFDIDHFKRVNDRYSHSAGDAALKMVSEALSAGCRPVDIVCRYSGEEFLMVMPGGGPDDAHARAEEFRTRIERMGIQFGGTEFSITTSIGVSVFPLHGATGRKAIAAADRALYVAKESGRNLTVIAE